MDGAKGERATVSPTPNSMTNEELIRYVDLDSDASAREREVAKRLANAIDYIAQLHDILQENDLIEFQEVTVQ